MQETLNGLRPPQTPENSFTAQDGIDIANNNTDAWLKGRNRPLQQALRRPLAFDLATERRRVLGNGVSSWNYFYDEITSYLAETYGKVGVRNYEHLILPDAHGRERLWFNSGRLELARTSYEEIVKDETLPDWYRERGLKDVSWVDRVEDSLPVSVNTRFFDISAAPFDVPLEERRESGFGVHSFIRVHEVVSVGGQKKLVSRAIRNYLALEEQEELFSILRSKTLEDDKLDRLDESWGIEEIEAVIGQLYDQTPKERKIQVPEEDLLLLKDNKIQNILQTRPIQNWIKGIFTMMRNYLTPMLSILKQVQGLEMAIQGLMNGEKVNLEVFENVAQNSFLNKSFTESQPVRNLIEVEYKPLPGCDGLGSGSGEWGDFSVPMTYEIMSVMSKLSPAERKLFCVRCGACGKVIMAVVEKGGQCPKCPAVRECV